MGANFQIMSVASTDKKIVEDAFSDAQSTDRYENGHSYSGGFGMANGLAFMVNEKFTSDDAADEWLEENAEKWGEALAVLVSSDGESHYRIGATCASGYPTRATAELANIPVTTHAIYLFGDATVGDGEGGLFIDTNNGNADTFVSGDGRTWYRAPDIGVDRLTSANLIELSAVNPGTAGKALLATDLVSDAQTLLDVAKKTIYDPSNFALPIRFKNGNFSMPNALSNLVLYVMTTGSDTIGTNLAAKGQTTGTAFLTIDAALNFAKKYWAFDGRMTVLELRVGAGSWGNFATGSNLQQGYDSYPFAIFLTAQDPGTPANWPIFDIISIGGFINKGVYVEKVTAGTFGVTRFNILCVNNVRIKANSPAASYCFYASLKAQLHIFGDVTITQAVSYSSSFIYAQQQGSIGCENGDAPLVFPMMNIVNPGNITSPSKYRAVFGAFVYSPNNIYPQLTYATKFAVDHTSFSSQTTTGTDMKDNAETGGVCVAWAGNDTSGYEFFADGRLRKWGKAAFTGIAAGNTAALGTITFDTFVPFSFTPRVHLSVNNSNINIAKAAGGTTLIQPLGCYNMGGGGQSVTVTYDAWGRM